jgi:hypothetical protein
MAHRTLHDRRCTYSVIVDRSAWSFDAVRNLARYLSNLAVTDCDVLVIDHSPRELFELHRTVLRWVGRHVSVSRNTDPVRAAVELSACEKVIVATEDVRYSPADIESMCQLLDSHEVVEPQQYLSPLPWWGGIEAGRMLVHRGIERFGGHSSTYAFRRSVIRSIRGADVGGESAIRRLALRGADVHGAGELFVRRMPPGLRDWVRERPRQADEDFAVPLKSVLFLAILPIAVALILVGGLRVAGGYAGGIAFASLALAVRGRIGASAFYPLRTCALAPVWVFERSVSIYWALFRRLRAVATEPPTAERTSGTKVVRSGVTARSSGSRTP